MLFFLFGTNVHSVLVGTLAEGIMFILSIGVTQKKGEMVVKVALANGKPHSWPKKRAGSA